jgi:hypothetical protein
MEHAKVKKDGICHRAANAVLVVVYRCKCIQFSSLAHLPFISSLTRLETWIMDQSTIGILSLPYELLLETVLLLARDGEQQQVLNTALSCRSLQEAAVAALFSYPRLPCSADRIRNFEERLHSRPSNASLVRRISMLFSSPKEVSRGFNWSKLNLLQLSNCTELEIIGLDDLLAPNRDWLTQTGSMLKRFVRLDTISFNRCLFLLSGATVLRNISWTLSHIELRRKLPKSVHRIEIANECILTEECHSLFGRLTPYQAVRSFCVEDINCTACTLFVGPTVLGSEELWRDHTLSETLVHASGGQIHIPPSARWMTIVCADVRMEVLIRSMKALRIQIVHKAFPHLKRLTVADEGTGESGSRAASRISSFVVTK